MRIKLFIIMAFCTAFVGCATLAKVASKPLMQNDFQLMKAEQDAQIVKLQGENSALKLQAQSLEAKLNAQVTATVGLNNRLQNLSAGRDVKQTTTNEGELMKFIFQKWYLVVAGLFGFLLSLMAGIWGLLQFVVSTFERIIKSKDDELSRELQYEAEQDEKLDKWQNELIEKLLVKKE